MNGGTCGTALSDSVQARNGMEREFEFRLSGPSAPCT